MSEPLICQNPACGHEDTEHDEQSGICLAKGCKCVCMRLDEDWEMDEDDDGEPLNFDHEV